MATIYRTTCDDCNGPTRIAFGTTPAYVSCRRCGHLFPNVAQTDEEAYPETGRQVRSPLTPAR